MFREKTNNLKRNNTKQEQGPPKQNQEHHITLFFHPLTLPEKPFTNNLPQNVKDLNKPPPPPKEKQIG